MQIIKSNSELDNLRLKEKLSAKTWGLLTEVIQAINDYSMEKSKRTLKNYPDANIIFFESSQVSHCMELLGIENYWILEQLLNHKNFNQLDDLIEKEYYRIFNKEGSTTLEEDQTIVPTDINEFITFLKELEI